MRGVQQNEISQVQSQYVSSFLSYL